MSLSAEAERQQRKQEMAAAFRIFARFGYYEGVAGHISARDPEHVDHLWLNPVGVHFARVRASDMVLVNSEGEVVSGAGRANKAAYPIHSQVHAARPDAVSVVHTHSTHGKAWSALGRLLDPLTQDGCAFYDDHGLFEDFSGVVFDTDEGKRIAHALGDGKAVILQNHGLLTVGETVAGAVHWFLAMESACRVQLLAEAAGTTKPIDATTARLTASQVGTPGAGVICFAPMFDWITAEEPDLLD